ncbi:hypothetical protein [Fusobacterium polymorphum]
MYLIIENIQEQFELYFNNEKDIELIKKMGNKIYWIWRRSMLFIK